MVDFKQHVPVQIVPMSDKGKLLEAFDVRIDELNVIDLKFLDGCDKPTLAVLYEDPKNDRHIKTYVVDTKAKVPPTPTTTTTTISEWLLCGAIRKPQALAPAGA